MSINPIILAAGLGLEGEERAAYAAERAAHEIARLDRLWTQASALYWSLSFHKERETPRIANLMLRAEERVWRRARAKWTREEGLMTEGL